MRQQHIVVTGNPADGFTHYGPFDSERAAGEWAARALVASDLKDSWIVELEFPHF